MTTEREIAARIIQLDADLDQVIQFRGERLAEEMEEFGIRDHAIRHARHGAKRGKKKVRGSGSGVNTYERTLAHNRLRMKKLMQDQNYRLKDTHHADLPSSKSLPSDKGGGKYSRMSARTRELIEFYAPQQQDGVLKKGAKLGAGVATVGTGALVAKSAYDSRAGRFDKAAEGFKGSADQKAGMAKRVKGWKGQSSAGRFGSAVQSNLRKVDKVPGLGKAGLGHKASSLVGSGIKRIFGR
jgi:hypothetical protein